MSEFKPIVMTEYIVKEDEPGIIVTRCPFLVLHPTTSKDVKAGSMWCETDCKQFVARNNKKHFVVCSVVEKKEDETSSNNQDSLGRTQACS